MRYQELEATHCAICNKKLQEGEEVYAHLSTDYILRLVHDTCDKIEFAKEVRDH